MATLDVAVFRASPASELVAFDRLPLDQQRAYGDLFSDPDFYGVIVPRGGAHSSVKAVSRDVALLLLSLREPGPLPAYVRRGLDDSNSHEILELVLDEVLEVELGGGFVSGAAAYEQLGGKHPLEIGEDRLSGLSIDAIRHAQALQIDDVLKLSARMYFYNRLPATPRWAARYPSPDDVVEGVLAASGERARHLLRRHWAKLHPKSQYRGWALWRSREHWRERPAEAPTYKLYVSPMPDDVYEAFPAVLEALVDETPISVKIGGDVYGMLRPDKIVVYFLEDYEMRSAAEAILDAVRGCRPQGVPFTAPIDPEGLVSWGIDPPVSSQLAWQERESWRLWTTNRLATALVAARMRPADRMEPWRFALERLRLEGVDIATWAPTREVVAQ